jgi:hypothetical protein
VDNNFTGPSGRVTPRASASAQELTPLKFYDFGVIMKFDNVFDMLEDSSRMVLMDQFGVGECCPLCHADLSRRVRAAFWAGGRIKCTPCGWRGTWRDGTPIDKSRLSASQFLFLAVLIRHSAADRQIADFVGIHVDTVRSWRLKMRGC